MLKTIAYPEAGFVKKSATLRGAVHPVAFNVRTQHAGCCRTPSGLCQLGRRPDSDAVHGLRQRTAKNTGPGFVMNPGLRTNHNYRVATFSIYNYYDFIDGFIVVIGGLRPVIIVMTPGM